MIISSKGRYALRVMVYLAVHHSDEYIPLKEISDKEELSKKYLETITRMLSKANLIEAASGHGGGYRLTRKPEDYSYTLPIWQGLADVINNYLDNMTLADVAATAIDKAGNKTAYNA